MEIIVETIRKETVKPSSPTPLDLKVLELSLLDQIASALYVSSVFWYPKDDTDTADDDLAAAEGRSQRLKKSLSETLARFYPFAGRIRSNSLIECNDDGVDYIEARVNCHIQDVLKQPDGELVRKLLPIELESKKALERILLVKVNFFKYGGMAIGVSISHKIADLSTLSLFIRSWAAMAQGSRELVSKIETYSSVLPPVDFLPFTPTRFGFEGKKFVTTRLVFEASKISMLQAEAASTDVPQPTRVEAVTVLIWKCAMAASTSNRGGFPKPSVLIQAVNIRKRLKPPLLENFIGNLTYRFLARTTPDCETELEGLFQKLRNGIKEFSENFGRKLKGSDAISAILELPKSLKKLSKRDDVDIYYWSSWCRFGLYEADFGWAKPRWVSIAGVSPPNCCTLMDSRDGEGVEAWLTLSEPEMAFLQRNEELLAFASVNPSAITVTIDAYHNCWKNCQVFA